MELYPYQVEGAAFLAQRGRALLADEMGLGKSAQAIEACDQLNAKTVLVICPASVRENWKREFLKFSRRKPLFGGLNADVMRQYSSEDWFTCYVYSYDYAAKVLGSDESQIDTLILDEAHYLKNPKAKRTKVIFGPKCDGVGGLVSRAKRVFCLTGTPTPNNPAELWPMLRAVMPKAISPRFLGSCARSNPMSYWTFVNRYCRTRDNGFGIQIVGGKNLADLKQNIAPFVLRRKKEDVLTDLPPIRFDELPMRADIPMSGEVATEMAVVRKAIEDKGVEGLREIAPHVAQYRRLCGLAKVPHAVAWVQDQIESGLRKLVVFAQHRDVLRTMRAAFENPAYIDGSVTDRQAQVDRFQNDPDCKVFLGQIQAAGTGLTLTAASDLLFVESSWVPAENEQAAMRIHRIGQKNACLVRFATLAGSIDEQVQRAVMRKTADIAKLFS